MTTKLHTAQNCLGWLYTIFWYAVGAGALIMISYLAEIRYLPPLTATTIGSAILLAPLGTYALISALGLGFLCATPAFVVQLTLKGLRKKEVRSAWGFVAGLELICTAIWWAGFTIFKVWPELNCEPVVSFFFSFALLVPAGIVAIGAMRRREFGWKKVLAWAGANYFAATFTMFPTVVVHSVIGQRFSTDWNMFPGVILMIAMIGMIIPTFVPGQPFYEKKGFWPRVALVTGSLAIIILFSNIPRALVGIAAMGNRTVMLHWRSNDPKSPISETTQTAKLLLGVGPTLLLEVADGAKQQRHVFEIQRDSVDIEFLPDSPQELLQPSRKTSFTSLRQYRLGRADSSVPVTY